MKHVEHIKAYSFLNKGLIYNLLALCVNCLAPLFNQHITFILMSNMLNRVQKILLLFIQINWMYVEHVKHIKAYNFFHNGLICNLLALLELSHSLVFNQCISFILMSNMLNKVQKILLLFIHSNWMYIKHVRQIGFFVQCSIQDFD